MEIRDLDNGDFEIVTTDEEYYDDPDIDELLLDPEIQSCKYAVLLTGISADRITEVSHNLLGLYDDDEVAVEAAKQAEEPESMTKLAMVANTPFGRITVEEMLTYDNEVESEYIGTIYRSDLISLLSN